MADTFGAELVALRQFTVYLAAAAEQMRPGVVEAIRVGAASSITPSRDRGEMEEDFAAAALKHLDLLAEQALRVSK